MARFKGELVAVLDSVNATRSSPNKSLLDTCAHALGQGASPWPEKGRPSITTVAKKADVIMLPKAA